MQKNQDSKTKKHINVKTIFGILLLFFAIIGVISSAGFVARTAIDIIDNKSEKEMFSDYVYPLVVLDPPTFESVDNLDKKTVLTAGIWNLLQNEKLSKYEVDDMGFLSVPKTDVEAYTAKLFGAGLTFEHQALGDANCSFAYNADEGVYYLPSNSVFFPYAPRVTEIHKNANVVELKVEYVPTGNLIKDTAKGKETQAKKTRTYILNMLDKNDCVIIAVKDSNASAVSSEIPPLTTSSTAPPAVSSTAPPAVSSTAPPAVSSTAPPAVSSTAPPAVSSKLLP